MNKDEEFMQRALELAQKGTGHVSPNPLVGAVIVKNGKIIGEGWHKKFGGLHAEVEAINNAIKKGHKIKGSTIYVNLEPCSHTGKTPPCALQLGECGVKRVVIGMQDPNPKVNGMGIRKLKKTNVHVDKNVLNSECERLNESFVHYVKTKTPFTALKAAISANGKIGETDKRVLISSNESLKFAHALRQKYDAILVGMGTVLVDDPKLTVRQGKNSKNPLRVILDPNLKSLQNPNLHIFADDNYLICAGDNLKQKFNKQLKSKNIAFFKIDKTGKFILKDILKYLGKQEIASLLIEGGSKTYANFINQKLIQKAYIIVSPNLIPEKKAIAFLDDKSGKDFHLTIISSVKSGVDTIFTGYLDI